MAANIVLGALPLHRCISGAAIIGLKIKGCTKRQKINMAMLQNEARFKIHFVHRGYK